MSDLLTIKELAAELRRSRTYVHALKHAMTAHGAAWIGNRTRITEIAEWLKRNPSFRCTSYARGKSS